MDLTPDRAALAVERHVCPNCDAPAGSACRTRGGKTAAKYHTPRFVLVPALREELEVLVPADRYSGRAWKPGPTLAVVPALRTERPVRIGYARTSTARQELASQLEALHRAECHKVFKEQISTRVKVRPELEKALALAHQFEEAAPETPAILTVHELKRLARNAAELMMLSAELQAGGIQLELLTGPLTGIYDPNGMGATSRRGRTRASPLRSLRSTAHSLKPRPRRRTTGCTDNRCTDVPRGRTRPPPPGRSAPSRPATVRRWAPLPPCRR
ncbi:recombinase family protein [Streptomyces leeuwenhoekii]|uniref:Resolvase Domain-Containing Protein n=1 Tax=Streptomyces leeuwenhoekii TaxID=1437453 RepID=A0A0F7W0W3_STRLW|nr:recombinase family protein [Streptomyces leeuwenhoekii]CQR62616.1 Resolvase Domain-Containing Protein [Streptomyces leeuwenhoekii]